jgi:hypothetical protein
VSRGEDLAALVEEHRCGIVLDEPTPQALTAALRDLSDEALNTMKRNALAAARHLCWEAERTKLRELYAGLSA